MKTGYKAVLDDFKGIPQPLLDQFKNKYFTYSPEFQPGTIDEYHNDSDPNYRPFTRNATQKGIFNKY